jgi:hypothetical protein
LFKFLFSPLSFQVFLKARKSSALARDIKNSKHACEEYQFISFFDFTSNVSMEKLSLLIILHISCKII